MAINKQGPHQKKHDLHVKQDLMLATLIHIGFYRPNTNTIKLPLKQIYVGGKGGRGVIIRQNEMNLIMVYSFFIN